jgi:hypothetical protein
MTMRPDEEWAKAIIEAELGVPVEQNDFNDGTSTYDLRIGDKRAPHAAIEVVAARDPDMEGLLAGTPEGDFFVPDQSYGVTGCWSATVRPGAMVKRLISDLPSIIADMQVRSEQELDDLIRNDRTVELAQLERLGVQELLSTDSPECTPARIYLFPEPQGGEIPESVEPLTRWCEGFLYDERRKDVLRKLSVDATERHAVVPVGFGGAPGETQAYLMRDVYVGQPPAGLNEAQPDLPEPITHLWVVSSSARLGVRWDGSSWLPFDARPVSMEAAEE